MEVLSLPVSSEIPVFRSFLSTKQTTISSSHCSTRLPLAGLEANSISFPFRRMLQNYNDYHFRLAELKKINSDLNEIETSIGKIHYDYLILATGLGNNFYGNKNIEKYSFPLKSVTEALELRNKILQNNEAAICIRDVEEKRGVLSLAIVGGGPTGIEIAGSLSEMRDYVLPKDYPEIDYENMEINLFDSSARLLKGMSLQSSARSEKYLKKLDVNIHFNSRIKDYDGRFLYLEDGRKFRTNTLIWAAGVYRAKDRRIGRKSILARKQDKGRHVQSCCRLWKYICNWRYCLSLRAQVSRRASAACRSGNTTG